jgi:type VI secretion system protein ImpM
VPFFGVVLHQAAAMRKPQPVPRTLSAPASAPGFFGKVPGRGDFLSRRVPAGLQVEWEAWLAGMVVVVRDALADAWPDDWLTAPLWHFVLGSNVSPPAGAAGVLIASADRVGRLYPFTIIGEASGAPVPDIAALTEWARAAEALALQALDDDFDPEAFDAALATLGPPLALEGPATVTGHWRLAFDGDWPADPSDKLADSARRVPGADQSAWYCRGSDRVPAMHLRCLGLPDQATAAAMITGAFDFPDD